MTGRILIGAAALHLLVTSVAFAASEGQDNLFAGDLGNMIWTLVIFLLVVVVLGKFAWGPILEALRGREEFIRSALEEAKADREKAEAALKEYEDRLNEARAEATAIVEEGRRDGEKVKRKVEEEAREEASRMIERAKTEISLATEGAVQELYSRSAALATDMAEKILRRELSPQDHERLIAESLAEMEGLKEN